MIIIILISLIPSFPFSLWRGGGGEGGNGGIGNGYVTVQNLIQVKIFNLGWFSISFVSQHWLFMN